MNAMLDKAMKAAAALPEADQAEVADTVLAMVELLRSGGPLLTDEQRRGVVDARREAQEGGFVTEHEMAAIWKKLGI